MSSRFISETELEEIRKKRQEEWEKVRKETDPLERPVEPYDSRSLFEKLQEQKQKKELEYEEAHKLKNMIKGLDDDEIEFLDFIDRTKLETDRLKELEEAKELNDFRNRVSILQQKKMEDVIRENSSPCKSKSTAKTHVSHQQKLLKEAVVTKKRKICEIQSTDKDLIDESVKDEPVSKVQLLVPQNDLKCIGILPGLGSYTESSEESSSDSEIDLSSSKIDLLGREIRKIEREEKES
ncbi:hypothetical protein WA026_011733 [Henosepilachna vigintioctopunctata]|uniref:FAM192A/Fyv6 N-terminal domain-containing protein n=1 Tax=Henosepilachna vigintioctopunctata TaxID=420089 RepID=A0AAW1UIX6_9CUCU